MPSTGVYNLPYLALNDPPDIPQDGQASMEAVETELVRIDAAVLANLASLDARLDILEALGITEVDGATVATNQSTASTSYVDLATVGPSVSVVTGTRALVGVMSNLANATAGGVCKATFAVSGASTVAASDVNNISAESSAAADTYRFGSWTLLTGLNAGANVFTMKYRATAGTAFFQDRHIIVVGLA